MRRRPGLHRMSVCTQLTMTPPVRLALIAAIGLAVALAVLLHMLTNSASHASGVIYHYVQQDGTVVYTEQWDQIPTAYREKVRSLDGDTLEPIVPTAATAQAVTRPTPALTRAARPVPTQESWGVIAEYLSPVLQRMQEMNLSLPSHTQLGIALTMFAFIAATFSILRMTENRWAKVSIKTVLVMMVTGFVYSLFMTDLAQNFVTQGTGLHRTNAAGSSAARSSPSYTGARTLNPLSSLTRSMQGTHDSSVEKAKQAAQAMNQANRQIEQSITELEPESAPQSAANQERGSGTTGSPQAPGVAAEPQSQPPQQTHGAIVHRVRTAAGQINQNYREAEPTAAATEGQ